MKRIDTTQWMSFVVGDLFDIHPTKAYKLTNKDLFSEGGIPVVVNSAYNNGIGGMTSLAPTEKGGRITFSDTVDANTIFYQEKDFVGYPHVQALYPTGKNKMCWSRDSLRFFAVSFRKIAITQGFDFGKKFRRDIAVKLPLMLPSTPDGTPDFTAMEMFIQEREKQTSVSLDALQTIVGAARRRIDSAKWKRFHLYDECLFTIDSGTKLDKVKMSSNKPSINFVGRANANNGVTCVVDEISCIKPYEAGLLTISLGGEYLGSCFVQDKPFYTSQNVNVLIPRRQMSAYAKMFIATVVFREGQLHYKAFSDELNRHVKRDFSIPLPVTSSGSIDFEYMERRMETLECKVKLGLSALQST